MARTQILVIGHNDRGCLQAHLDAAYETGRLIAERGAILVTGGMGGVMRAASRGAREVGGISVGIVPQNDASMANEFCDIVVPTGVGLMRDFVNVYSADGIIIVGGGVGDTLGDVRRLHARQAHGGHTRNRGNGRQVRRRIPGSSQERLGGGSRLAVGCRPANIRDYRVIVRRKKSGS